MIFSDRGDAGRQLAGALAHLRGRRPVVVALVRGGLPVASEVAQALSAPLDIILVRKIGVPWQPELAVGAVVDGSRPELVINPDVQQLAGISQDYVEAEAKRLWTSADKTCFATVCFMQFVYRPRGDFLKRVVIKPIKDAVIRHIVFNPLKAYSQFQKARRWIRWFAWVVPAFGSVDRARIACVRYLHISHRLTPSAVERVILRYLTSARPRRPAAAGAAARSLA